MNRFMAKAVCLHHFCLRTWKFKSPDYYFKIFKDIRLMDKDNTSLKG